MGTEKSAWVRLWREVVVMKRGDKITFSKYGVDTVATVAIIEAYHVIAYDGHNTIIFPKKD